MGISSGLIAILIIALVIGAVWFAFILLKRKLASAADSMLQLVRLGVSTTGRIASTEKRRMSRSRRRDSLIDFEYFVTYTFDASDGTKHEKERRVSALDFNKYTEGQPIGIVYLPSDPSQSATRDMVDLVRAEMGQNPSLL